jgi:ketosteroid isomerase-like protein
MPRAARSRSFLPAPLLLAAGSLACPAPTPRTEPARGETPAKAEPVVASSPKVVEPSLAADGVRPVVRTFWQALEAVDAGDAGALAHAMTEDGRWLPPGRFEESLQGAAQLQRAMNPWSSDGVEIDVRRVIDPGEGAFVAQVSVASGRDPTLRHELVLLVEPRDDAIAAVHHFGDPLGPLRWGPSKEEPLDLGLVGEPTMVAVSGVAAAAQMDLAEQLTAAIERRDDDAVRARLAADVVLHDVAARRTRRGPDGYLTGIRETLGAAGHLRVDRRLAGSGFAVLEGAVLGREAAADATGAGAEPAEPQEHGFADVHRMVDGAIAETWHYVNRRGRPYHPRPAP